MLDLSGYKLTFDDEFNARSISQTGAGTTWADIRSQWRFDANSDIGFGHSSFVDPASGYDPFRVAGGALSITAVPDRTPSGYPGSWESGLITTQGRFSQTYGYFEMRADLSDAKGGWDAFWLLPDTPAANPNHLPGWQELDVVEHYGAYNQGTYRWIHTTDPGPNKNPNADLQVFSNNPAQLSGYHTYGMDWEADRISFYFDGQYMGSQATPTDMHGPMYLLANLATQSDADEAGVPMTMKIDYIRAYSNASSAVAITQDTVSAPDVHDPGLYGATVATRATSLTGASVANTSTSSGSIATNGGTTQTSSTHSGATAVATSVTASTAVSVTDTATSSQSAHAGTETSAHESAATVAFAPDANTLSITGLYYGLFDRAPPVGGLQVYTNSMTSGTSLHDVAQSLLSSGEYKVDSTGLTDVQFVEAMYGQILGRASDNGGKQAWGSYLAQGGPRGGVITGFTDSPEFQSEYAGQSSTTYVEGLYEHVLGRTGDTVGATAWAGLLDSRAMSRTDVAHALTGSSEFQTKYVAPSDASFVESLYANALGRHADAGGLQAWTGMLAHGTARADVAIGIVGSVEAQAHLLSALETAWHLA